MRLNKKFWKNKKVLITGHTGFKGGWLSVLLNLLGSKIYGYAKNPEGRYNFFNQTGISKLFINDYRNDIKDLNLLKKKIKKIKPDIIFHLAAQSSVIESFKNSKNTVMTNVIGTINVLEAIKNQKSVKGIVIVTTDKVYQNYTFRKHFKEDALLGGDDVYSGSKACCEILASSYRKSFFSKKNCNIATVRAGNCFGGGDWTKDRIVKDSLEQFYKNKNLILRNPNATRPWQHVMEPLVGYLILAEKLSSKNGKNYSTAWNFGPSSKQNMTVINLAKKIRKQINSKSKILIRRNEKKFNNKKFKIFESKDLNIDSSKAYNFLKWKPYLSIDKSVNLTVKWYSAFRENKDLLLLTKNQIKDYIG
jgi:CDP-glucose 4,6-dehydratase